MTTVQGFSADGGLLLVVDDMHGRRVGEVETRPDPFDPRVRRDIRWLCRQTGCDRADAMRAVWRAFIQEAAA